MNILESLSVRLLPRLLPLLFSSLKITLKPSPANRTVPEGKVVFAFWHGKMVTGWLLARQYFMNRNPSAVVSLSEDGRILAGTLHELGFSMIRGSSSKGNRQVVEKMRETLETGKVVVITPDGPRGPRHQFKYGALRLAAESRTPFLFAEIRYSRAWRLKSWDRFEIPWPFSRVEVVLHEIAIPEYTTEEAFRTWCQNLSGILGHD